MAQVSAETTTPTVRIGCAILVAGEERVVPIIPSWVKELCDYLLVSTTTDDIAKLVVDFVPIKGHKSQQGSEAQERSKAQEGSSKAKEGSKAQDTNRGDNSQQEDNAQREDNSHQGENTRQGHDSQKQIGGALQDIADPIGARNPDLAAEIAFLNVITHEAFRYVVTQHAVRTLAKQIIFSSEPDAICDIYVFARPSSAVNAKELRENLSLLVNRGSAHAWYYGSAVYSEKHKLFHPTSKCPFAIPAGLLNSFSGGFDSEPGRQITTEPGEGLAYVAKRLNVDLIDSGACTEQEGSAGNLDSKDSIESREY